MVALQWGQCGGGPGVFYGPTFMAQPRNGWQVTAVDIRLLTRPAAAIKDEEIKMIQSSKQDSIFDFSKYSSKEMLMSFI